jgi:hypothetical protein
MGSWPEVDGFLAAACELRITNYELDMRIRAPLHGPTPLRSPLAILLLQGSTPVRRRTHLPEKAAIGGDGALLPYAP